MQKLLTGAAYHGNRMLHHAQADLRDMADNHMNLVVHMFSHTDWDRHCRVMKDMVEISKEAGLEVWVDTSSAFFELDAEEAKKLIGFFGEDHVLFGSDYPMWNAADEIRNIKNLGLSSATEEKIFSGNLLKLLNL